jgi:HEAT repeat protein
MMIRATFIAAALGVCALTSEAQIPTTPAPTPSPAPPVIAQPAIPATPAPSPRPVTPPALGWEPMDLPDLSRLDRLNMDLHLAPMPDMDFDIPDDLDLSDLNGRLSDLSMTIPSLDFDLAMPPIPPMPPMALEPMEPMEPMTPLEPMIIAPMAIEPMIMEPLEIPPMPAMPPMPDMAPLAGELWALNLSLTAPVARAVAAADRAARIIPGQSLFERQFGGITSDPPKAWAQSDPADSLYRLARETLNRGEYRRAAQLFGDITQKFPNSVYASDARYWKAFALYRIGNTNDLRDALATLQDNSKSYRQASLQADAPALAARIRGALAAQGDPQARAQLVAASQPGDACDREDVAVRVEALNSLGRTDPESTTPILRRLLARKDECSTGLRRAALWLLGRRTDAEATELVMSSARNDPDMRVRADALRFLAAMPGDQAISTIEEMTRTPGNEELQRSAIAALGRSDSPRARQGIRNIVERTDLNENLRAAALSSIDAEHTSDNGAYLRSVYPRLDTPRLKAAAIRAIARIGGNDNDQWLLSVVRNPNEPSDVRAMALGYAGRSTISIADLAKMYDVAGDRPLREQLIRLYAQRQDPQATDKLLEIAKSGTDPDMRRYAISALSRKNDPRTRKLLLEIIDK